MIMYQLTESSTVIRLSDKLSISADPANADYAEHLAWLGEGNEPMPASVPVIDMAQVIAARRYEAEVGGIVLNGITIATDDRSKLLINGAALEAVIDPDYTMQWKAGDAFVDLTGGQIIAIARSVRSHVQACFNRESELLSALDAGTFTNDMLEQGWPT